MIQRKYSNLLFAVLMGFSMVFIISFFNTVVKNGFNENFIKAWSSSFFCSYPIAIPLILILPQPIRLLINRITFGEEK